MEHNIWYMVEVFNGSCLVILFTLQREETYLSVEKENYPLTNGFDDFTQKRELCVYVQTPTDVNAFYQ